MLDLRIGTRQITPADTGLTSQPGSTPRSPSTSSASSSVTIGDRSTAPTSRTAESISPKPIVPSVVPQLQPQPQDPPSDPSDLSRRADDVIARLTSSASASSSNQSLPAYEVQRRANDVISRIETEARAREVIDRFEKQTHPPAMMAGGMPMARPYLGIMPGMMMPQMMMGPGGMLIPVGPAPGLRMPFPPPGQAFRPPPPGQPMPGSRPPVRPPTSSAFVPRPAVAPETTPLPRVDTPARPPPRAMPPMPPTLRPSVPSPNHTFGSTPLLTPGASQHSANAMSGPSKTHNFGPNRMTTPTTPIPPIPPIPRDSTPSTSTSSTTPSRSFEQVESSKRKQSPHPTTESWRPDPSSSHRRSTSPTSQPPRSPTPHPNPHNQVYLGSLPPSTTLPSLRAAFSALSPIESIELRTPYAMIEFEDEGAAERAVEVYDEGWFGGVMIRVERAIGKKGEQRPVPNLKRPSSDVGPMDRASKRAR